MEVDLQDDRKRRHEGVLAMALDSSGKALVTTDDSPFSLDKDSSSVFDLESLQSRLANNHELP